VKAAGPLYRRLVDGCLGVWASPVGRRAYGWTRFVSMQNLVNLMYR